MRKNIFLAFCLVTACFLIQCAPALAQIEFKPPDDSAVQVSEDIIKKLDASLSRQDAVAFIKADPNLKSYVEKEFRRITQSEIDWQTITSGKPVKTLEKASDPEEAAYQSINWNRGINFRPNNIPSYGSRRWKLGFMTCYPVLQTSALSPNELFLDWTSTSNTTLNGWIAISLELPNKPALYLVTIKLWSTQGTLNRSWLTAHPFAPYAAIFCRYIERPPNSSDIVITPITLNILPDGGGLAGIIPANPSGNIASYAVMRKVTGRIEILLSPANTFPQDRFQKLIFSGINIMSL